MRILILFIFFLSAIVGYSKPLNIDNTLKSIDISIQKIYHVNDSLIKANSKLIEKVEYDEKLLDRYDKLNNTLFTVAGIILALFGVIVPIIGYILVYRSTKQERVEAHMHLEESKGFLNSIRHDMDKHFDEYNSKLKNRIIDNALLGLEKNDEIRKINNISYVESYMYEGYSDIQLSRIIKLIKTNIIEKDTSGLIGDFLIVLKYSDSILVEDFFSEIIRTIDSPYYSKCIYQVIIYFAKYDKVKYMDDIAKSIVHDGSIENMISNLIDTPTFLNKLMNNDYLASNLERRDLLFFRNLVNSESNAKYDLFNTKLYKKYIEQ